MRKSTCLLPNVLLFTALGVALALGQQNALHAQDEGVVPASYQSGSFFNRNLGAALRLNYHTNGYGTQDDVVSLGGMKVHNMDGATVFLDGQGTLSDDFGGGFNLGVGYRELTTLGLNYDAQRILGIGFWTDGQSTGSDNFFTQLGFSLESLGDSYDLRLNGHFPLESTQTSEAILTGSGASLFSGNNLFNATERVTIDRAHNVVDGEFAKRIRDLEAWAFVGGYYLGGGEIDDAGYRVGVRGYAVPDLAVSLQVTEDAIYGGNLMVGATWFIGRTNKCNGPCGTILDRFREPVLRNDFIATTSRQINRASGDAAINPDNDLAKNFLFVDSGANPGGTGTFESPFRTLAEAEAAQAEFDTIVGLADSTFTDTLTLQNNVDFIGFGNDIVHICDTTNFGNVTLPNTTAGAAPILNVAGMTAFTAGDNSQINNAVINDAAVGVLADTVASPQLANLVINDAVDGVVLQDVTGTSVVENTVEINRATGRAINVNGGGDGASIAATINDTTGRSLVVQNKTGGTIDFTGTISDDAAGTGNTSMGVLFGLDPNVAPGMGNVGNTDTTLLVSNEQDIRVTDGANAFEINSNTTSTVNVTGAVDLTATGTGNGLVIDGNTDDTTITFADLNATAANGDTVNIQDGSNVTISSDTSTATRQIENTGTGRAFFNSGGPTGGDNNAVVTVNSNIFNEGGGTAVEIRDRTENAVTFTGTVTVDDMASAGVLIEDNEDGTILFTNTLTLDTGTSDAVVLRNNDDLAMTTTATISFTDLDIDTTTGNAFTATDGGNLIVTSTNGTNDINVNGAGNGLTITGMTIDPANVLFDVVTVTGGGTGIDLQNLDGTGQVTIGGGTNAGDGGMLMTTGTAINVNNVNNVAMNNVTVDNSMMAGAAGLIVTGQQMGSIANFSGLDITTEDADAVNVNGNDDGIVNITTLTATAAGTGDGVDINNADGSTVAINVSDATINANGTGRGYAARGGGTLSVAGTNTIDSAGATAFEVTNVENLTAANVTINNTAAQGVVVTGQNTGTDSVTLTNFDVTTTTANAVTVATNTDGTVNINSLTAESGNGGTVVLDDNAGAAINLDGMTVEATGSGNAFSMTNGGALALANANGPNNVTANTGTGVNIDGTAGAITIDAAGATFDNVDVTAAGGTAINLVAATGGQIAVNGGTLTSSNLAPVGAAGINVDNVDDVAISGVTVDYSAGAGAGLVATNGGGDTLALANVDVTTSTGNGVSVDGHTLTATGSNNITTTTGTGLNIANADIGAGGATFATVNVNGATNGVTLSNITGNLLTVGSGTNPGDGGTLSTTGTAITVDDVESLVVNNVTIDNDAGLNIGAGLNVTNQTAGSSAAFNGLTVNTTTADAVRVEGNTGGTTTITGLTAETTDGDVVTVDNNAAATTTINGMDLTSTGAGVGFTATNGGTLAAIGTNNVTTDTGVGLNIDGVTIGGSGANFTTVNVTNGATNGVVLNDLSGGQVRVGPATAGVNGAGGTLTTTGDAILVTGVTNAVFNDITTNTSGASNGATVEHTTAAASSILFNNLTHTSAGTGNGVVVTDNGTGELDFTLRNSTLNVASAGAEGFNFITGANTGEVDIRLDGNTISAGAESAVSVDLTAGTGDVQFLINGGNSWTNNSAANATATFTVSTNRTLNATVGDQGAGGAFDENTFSNTNAGGTAFEMTSNSGAAIVSLDLRGNNASGGSVDYLLTETLGTFGVVDRTATITGGTNNNGAVSLGGGGVEADFDDLVPPIKQVD